MRILKFNENLDNDIFDYIKLCFIDISDEVGVDDGIFYQYDDENDVYEVSINKYEEEYDGSSFERFYENTKKGFEYIQSIKDAIDKVRIGYPKCLIDFDEHEFYDIRFNMK